MNQKGKSTQCIHSGNPEKDSYTGLVTPVYPATAFTYLEVEDYVYPRYFNTPNQRVVSQKLAALEKGEEGMVFSSGMAAVVTVLFAFLKKGDHAIFQNDLYGGTHSAVAHELERFGIGFDFVDSLDPLEFEKAIKPNTRLVFIETPSNPLLRIMDIQAIAKVAASHGLVSVIDSSFASPVNQNPIDLGIDVVIHSGTKYLGGHSDLSCGAVITTEKLMEKLRTTAIHFGGNLDARACALLERSLKTLALRVERQNENAQAVAEFLESHTRIDAVHYPGLASHPQHALAKSQMHGFGGMLSFEVQGDVEAFVKGLKLVAPAMSLGGVESTVTSPVQTSHARISAEERARMGIRDNLLRLSVGVEDVEDLLEDLGQALES